MVLIKIFMGLHILLGQYSNISTVKVTSAVLRLYCIGVCLFVNYFMVYYMCLIYDDRRNLVVCLLFTVEYIFWCILSHINCQTFISSFTRAILSCDSVMGYKRSVIENKCIFILLLLNIFINLTSLSCDIILSQYWRDWIYENGVFSISLLVSQSFMLDTADFAVLRLDIVIGLLQNRLMKLRRTLEENTIPVHIMNEDEIESKVAFVRKCVLNYKQLLDAFDDVYTHLHFIMVVAFSFTSPQFVVLVYFFIKEIIFNFVLWRIMIVDLIRFFIRIASPCIICELCYSEVDRIKMLLVKHITLSQDEELRAELERAMDYMTRRPFRFSLLRTFRVDIKMPVTFLAVACTYTVLMIEFTHFVL